LEENAIKFIECSEFGYGPRTMQNASAAMTIAIAKIFTTAGERLTKKSVLQQGKYYIPIHINWIKSPQFIKRTAELIDQHKPQTINIAGNGLYTLKVKQEEVDNMVYEFLNELLSACNYKPELIRSGGQTGIDEAGLKAAHKLGISSLCLAPKGWTLRGIDGVDINDEKLFKARFRNITES
jgi:hypothetical protein